ncbi:DUF5667 domain-containing protein [Patescibacteria group bacterium]
MSKSKILLISLLSIGILSIGMFAIVLAQESEPMPASEEAIKDMEITIEDLGASPATILPDSIFHPFKRFGRNFMEAITFDPIKDAELKLQHANQELSEIKQLIDKNGMENIDQDDLINSVEWFEGKMEKIKDASETLKNEKSDNLAEVETFLNDLTDKQFKGHKVFEGFHGEIAENKDKIENSENIFATMKDKQSNTLKRFGETLTVIDDPERISERLSSVANNQKGSEFKLIKTNEILKKLEEQAPDQAKEAIEKAQEKTFENFQEDMAELPPIVRAEKFEKYTSSMPGDETVYLSIFEKIKQLPNVPQDILEKIEEVKEFTVKRFEDKIERFEDPKVKDQFFENLNGNDLDDILALEELKSKITAKQKEIKNRIDKEYTEGVIEFKKQFTDAQSKTQANRFERMIKEMTSNPNPKIMKLINELEQEVSQDSEKKAFIEDIKIKTKTEFENKFRQEGDRFFDRISTFNPEDMMIFKEIGQTQSFDTGMMEKFLNYQTNIFKEHIQEIESPEMFNRFDERMRLAPIEVINTIKTIDNDFGNAMQFKARKMMEMELELKEREMQMEMERAWRENEDNFQIQLRQVQSDEEKAKIYEQRREQDFSLMKIEFENRKAIMEARFSSDPFCDAICQEVQRTYLEQDMANREWHLQEDARMREFELEIQMKNQMQQDPFAGKCYDPRSCMEYCNQNPSAPGCGGMGQMPIDPYMMPRTEGSVMPGMPIGPPPCPQGQINIPTGPGQWVCKQDPYYRPPESFRQCPPGNFWNEQKGFCEFDQSLFQPMPMPGEPYPGPYPPTPPMTFCGPGEYWDNMRGCVQENIIKCGPGEYWDFYEQNCRMDNWKSCPPGEYWDQGRNSCIRDVVNQVQNCQPGQFYDYFKRMCIAEHFPIQCGPNEHWDAGTQSCRPSSPVVSCPVGQYWDDMKKICVSNTVPNQEVCSTEWNPVCGVDNITYSNECNAMQKGITWKYRGECTTINDQPPVSGYCGDGICENEEYCPQDCEIQPIIECNNNNYCDYNENPTSCPNDCMVTAPEVCPSNMYNDYTSSYTCSYSNCPNGCSYDQNGCPINCTTSESICPENPYTTSDGVCDHTTCPNGCNFINACPSSCMIEGIYSCGGYIDSMSCINQGCIWCSDINACYIPGHICGSSGTCPTNSFTTSAGACNYTTCPNGCNFINGCPNECIATTMEVDCANYTDPASCYADPSCGKWCEGESSPHSCFTPNYSCGTMMTCPSTIYNNYTSTAYCNIANCPYGCNFDNTGCPISCMTNENVSVICPSTIYNNYTTDYFCNSAECPNGCIFDYNGCPTGCNIMNSETSMGCGSYTDYDSCSASPGCIWCEGESSPYSCFGEDFHTCGENTINCYSFNNNDTCAVAGCTWCTTDSICHDQGYECTMPSCPEIYDPGTCDYQGCVWCESDYMCHESGYTCTSSCPPCDWDTCPNGCEMNYDGCWTSGTCMSSPPPTMSCNYDNICDYDETMESCPSDCSGGCMDPECSTPPPASIFGSIKIFFQRLFGF